MPHANDPVKVIETALALGFSLPEAFQRALGQSLSEWGSERGFGKTAISMCLNGYHGRVYPEIRDAFADAFGVGRDRVDTWIAEWAERRVA